MNTFACLSVLLHVHTDTQFENDKNTKHKSLMLACIVVLFHSLPPVTHTLEHVCICGECVCARDEVIYSSLQSYQSA